MHMMVQNNMPISAIANMAYTRTNKQNSKSFDIR